VYYALFNGFPERLNADCLPPSFKLDQADGEVLLELLLFIQGDAINYSLQLNSDALRISHAPGLGFCLSIRWAIPKLQSHVSSHVCRPVSLVFGCSFDWCKLFGEYASGTGCLVPNFLQ